MNESARRAAFCLGLAALSCGLEKREVCDPNQPWMRLVLDANGNEVSHEDCETGTCDNGQCTPKLGKIISMSASSTHACAVTENGRVWCWGRNASCELGRRTGCGETGLDNNDHTLARISSLAPYHLDSQPFVAALVASGWLNSCVVTVDRKVYCWGSNIAGQLGDSSLGIASAEPKPIRLDDRAELVTVGAAHVCALLDTGKVTCWGANYLGQCGQTVAGDDGASDCPAPDPHSTNFGPELDPTPPSVVPLPEIDVANDNSGAPPLISREHFSCARANSQLYCWGANRGGSPATEMAPYAQALALSDGGGQLGDTKNPSRCFSAEPVLFPELVRAFSLGHAAAFAVYGADVSKLYGWGYNGGAQLGRDTGVGSNYNSFGDVLGLDGNPLIGVSCPLSSEGSDQCAVVSNEIKCWGTNNYGELGDGITVGNIQTLAATFHLTNPDGLGLDKLSDDCSRFSRGDDYGCIIAGSELSEVWCWGNVPDGNAPAPPQAPDGGAGGGAQVAAYKVFPPIDGL